jgi:hypothetical protein
VLRLERSIYLSLTVLAVVVYWRSAIFVYRWLPIVYCGGESQSFFDWYSLFVIAPIIPFVGMVLALLLARRSVLTIVRVVVGATSAIAAAVIARIFGEMMIPGAWGDCLCCGGTPLVGPRDIQPPLVLQLSPIARTTAAIAILVVMLLATLAFLIAELRGTDRLRYLVSFAASLIVFFCAGWWVVRAPGFVWWTDGWRYVAVMSGIASITCAAGAVAIVRKSVGAFVAALLLITLSYVVIYHAISFFGMIAA